MDVDIPWRPGRMPVDAGPEAGSGRSAEREAQAALAITALYREHALGLTRLALVLVQDRQGGRGHRPGRVLRAAPALGSPARHGPGAGLCPVSGAERLPVGVPPPQDLLASASRPAGLVRRVGGAG